MDTTKDRTFSALFDNARIPHPVFGTDDLPASYTASDIQGIGKLADEIIDDLAAAKPVRAYFDNDGTLFRFDPSPTNTKMDKDCFAALVRLSQYPNFLATSLTGRDVKEASELMLTPGYLVKDSHGRTLNAEGDKTLRFAITGSHGVENYDLKNGAVRYDFSKDYGPKVNGFIKGFQEDSAALRKEYPGIHVEDGKHAAVGINVRMIEGGAEKKQEAYDRALALLEKYASSEDNPAHKTTGKPVFQIKKEGMEEIELRPVGFGKDFGILEFGKPDKTALTLFFGDSFKQPDGTDLDAAALINNKDHFERGNVLLVRNGRFEPEPDGPARPRAVFANPTLLGKFLNYVADKVEERRPLAGPIPPSQELRASL